VVYASLLFFLSPSIVVQYGVAWFASERASGVNWVGICADEWNEYNESIIYHEKHHVFCTFMCV
jgi:hypothetical protein